MLPSPHKKGLDRAALLAEFEEIKPILFDLYRDLHRHPDLGLQCRRTALQVQNALSRLGLQKDRDYTLIDGLAESGFAIILHNGEGPVYLYRADMDALQLTDLTELDYASRIDGRHHGCGHDLHSTLGAGIAALMHRNKKHWAGKAVFVWQPGEEAYGGAERMVKDGLYEQLIRYQAFPKGIVFTHVFDKLPAGAVGLRGGDSMAGAAFWDLTIKAAGGHGGRMIGVNEIAHDFESFFYRLPTRISPFDAMSVNITGRDMTRTFNVNPEKITLKISARFYRNGIMDTLQNDLLPRIFRGIATIYNLPEGSFELSEPIWCPKLVSDDALFQHMHTGMQPLTDRPERVRYIEPIMSSEDITQLATQIRYPDGVVRNIPLQLVRLGVQNPSLYDENDQLLPGASAPGVHTGYFAPHYELALQTGVVAIGGGFMKMFNF